MPSTQKQNNKEVLPNVELCIIVRSEVKDILKEARISLSTLRKRIHRVLQASLLRPQLPHRVSLCLTLMGNQEIHELNREYRGKDKPTDVLSFALLEGESFVLPEELAQSLGDIMVSVETAIKQAQNGALPRLQEVLRDDHKWTAADELSFLVLHGLLHLLGFDHMEEQEAQEMESLEADLLAYLLPNKTTH